MKNSDVRELAAMGETGQLNAGKSLKSAGASLKGSAGAVKAGLAKMGTGLGVIDNVVKAEKFAESLADGASNEQYTEEIQAGGDLALSGMGHVPGVGTVLGLTDAGMEVATGDGLSTHTANLGTFLGNTWAHYEYGTPMVWQWGDPITDSWVWGDKEWDCPDEGGDKDPRPKNPSGNYVLLTDSKDPNLIIGPAGEPGKKWVSVKDRLPYTVLFENDTTASAPARYVKITTAIEPKQDRNTFQLGSFGFNDQTFTVPNNTASYYQRLDCRDSIGLFVDVTAGYDQVNNIAFWEFQSIDPISLLPPSDPLKGFLLLKDTARPAYGNGFVNFSMKPVQSAVTLDTIGAKASIVFDGNDTIPTNTHTNTIDAFAPASHMNPLSATSSNPVALSWGGADDPGGCGIRFYTLYVSADGTNFNMLKDKITRTDTTFSGAVGSQYYFFVLATDSVGNTQMLGPGAIVSTYIGTGVVPVTLLEFKGTNRGKENLLAWSTSAEIDSKSFIGSTRITGVDLTLTYLENIGRSFNLTNTFTFTTAKNMVTATNEDGTAKTFGGGYFNGQSQTVTVFEKGYAPGYFYGFKTQGLFQNAKEIAGAPSQPGARPGDIRFVDVNGDGAITDADKTQIGNPFAKFTMGWNFTAAWKGLDLNVFTYASYGNDVYRAYERNANFSNKDRSVLARWTGEGSTNDAKNPRYTFEDVNSNIRVSDRYVEDGSFIKIKNIQLGYNFPASITQKFLSGLRIYAQVKNAYTFTKYQGFDPEISGGLLDTGIDRGAYPQARTYAIGLDIKL